MTATITKLKTAQKNVKRSAPRTSKAYIAEQKVRRYWAGSVGMVIVITTALSLTHQADGVAMITHSAVWMCWAMAICLDLGYLLPEAAVLSIKDEKLKTKVERTAFWTRWGLTGASAVMNALGFGMGAEGWMIVPAVAFGVALPFVIQQLTKIASTLYMGR